MGINLSIKNVPAEIAARLKQRAKRNHRSLQGELMTILQEAAVSEQQAGRLSTEDILARVKQLGLTSADESAQWIRQDRDSR